MVLNKLPPELSWVERFKKYSGNPILRPQGRFAADCVFNPGAIVRDGRVWLLCRCINFADMKPDNNWSVSSLVWAKSDDGINFTLENEPFLYPESGSEYPGGFEDPRLVYLPEEKLYMLTYTGVRSSNVTPGMAAFSHDLVHWEFAGEVFPARAVAVVDRRVDGCYWAYYGNSDVSLCRSTDLLSWSRESNTALSPRPGFFDASLCEAAGAPIVTDSGILLIYNGAARGSVKNRLAEGKSLFRAEVDDHVYSIGWALFDRNRPGWLLARSDKPFLKPELPYELYGISKYTTFGEGLVTLGGKHFLYYGCSDTRIAAAISE